LILKKKLFDKHNVGRSPPEKETRCRTENQLTAQTKTEYFTAAAQY
jgi:hypothetical protein